MPIPAFQIIEGGHYPPPYDEEGFTCPRCGLYDLHNRITIGYRPYYEIVRVDCRDCDTGILYFWVRTFANMA